MRATDNDVVPRKRQKPSLLPGRILNTALQLMVLVLIFTFFSGVAAAKNVNLAGSWTGTATTNVDNQPFDVTVFFTQTRSYITATIVWVAPGDTPEILTGTGEIRGFRVIVRPTGNQDVRVNGIITSKGISGTGGEVDDELFRGSFTSDGRHLTGSVTGSEEDSISWNLDRCQKCPTEENTSWDRFYETYGLWNATLLPSSLDYDGQLVQEQNGNPSEEGSGMDTCWFAQSMYAPFDQITGGEWPVAQGNPDPVGHNQYGQDMVGYTPAAVAYYRSKGRAPCGTTFQQLMVFQDPDSGFFVPYGSDDTGDTNTLGAEIGTNTVSSTRAGQTMTQPYK